jgi:peptidoglycan/xylan/chitin deacetylase (PgdA/CDA1 family)
MLQNPNEPSAPKLFTMRTDRPLVSFTFDDAPDSAFLNGAAILESSGVRGTFFIAGALCGCTGENWRLMGREHVRTLHDRGHEIGCHTFTHVRVDRLDTEAMDKQCERNQDYLGKLCPGLTLTNFCYPYGIASTARKMQLQTRFDSCRGTSEGINFQFVDLGMLKAIELFDRTLTPIKLRDVVESTRKENGWLIFYTHDVAETPSEIGCTPRLLQTVLDTVQASGIPSLPISEALSMLGYSPDHSKKVELH